MPTFSTMAVFSLAALALLLILGPSILGLSALILSSAALFSAMKLLGGAYLIYLGCRTLLSAPASPGVAAPALVRPSRIFTQGTVVNALNPKTALFFFAFRPQFVHPEQGSVLLQTLVLGIDPCDRRRQPLRAAGSHGESAAGKRYVTGGVYLTLSLGILFSGHRAR